MRVHDSQAYRKMDGIRNTGDSESQQEQKKPKRKRTTDDKEEKVMDAEMKRSVVERADARRVSG